MRPIQLEEVETVEGFGCVPDLLDTLGVPAGARSGIASVLREIDSAPSSRQMERLVALAAKPRFHIFVGPDAGFQACRFAAEIAFLLRRLGLAGENVTRIEGSPVYFAHARVVPLSLLIGLKRLDGVTLMGRMNLLPADVDGADPLGLRRCPGVLVVEVPALAYVTKNAALLQVIVQERSAENLVTCLAVTHRVIGKDAWVHDIAHTMHGDAVTEKFVIPDAVEGVIDLDLDT